MALTLKWIACGEKENRHWCNLERLILPLDGDPHGVYIIWMEGLDNPFIRVGQGNISDRLADHRKDPKITEFLKAGVLLVTWAKVSTQYTDGVERYLAETLLPQVGHRFPTAEPIEVNLP